MMKADKSIRIRITGWGDDIGGEEVNKRVSLQNTLRRLVPASITMQQQLAKQEMPRQLKLYNSKNIQIPKDNN